MLVFGGVFPNMVELPSLKLAFPPLKNGWLEDGISFWDSAYCQGAFSGTVYTCGELYNWANDYLPLLESSSKNITDCKNPKV